VRRPKRDSKGRQYFLCLRLRLCSRYPLSLFSQISAYICRLHYRAASLRGAITAVDVIVIAGLCGERTYTRAHLPPERAHVSNLRTPLLSLNGRPGFRTR
jgi:hypothetical protein